MVLPILTPMEVSLGSVLLYLMSYMFSLGMQLWICHAVVIEPVSVVTKLKVEIHRNIVLHVV